jgi:Gpi18-like mannosyltransferase
MPSHAFFPAVSWLGWPLWKLTNSDLFTVHTVATATGLAAFICVWGVSKAWRNERIARRAVLLFAVFPSSLFLWAFYSEGLFIALGAGAVWADRRGRRGIATALLIGIGATRSVGVLIPAVIVLARIIRLRRIDKWCVAYAAAGLSSLLVVLAVMQAQVGDAFAFMKVQSDWGRSLSAPWTTVMQGYQNLWPHRGTVMVPALVARNLDLWCVLIVVVIVAYAAFSRRDRFPMETWMLGVAMVILPLCSSVLASFNRFVFADWVIYPVCASALDRLPRPWRIGAMTAIFVSLGLTAYALIGRFSIGRFIG